MDNFLKIECLWKNLPIKVDDPLDGCRGAIGIQVNEFRLTNLVNILDRVYEERVHASAYTLGAWFASNWWRLRWEPETPDSFRNIDWRLSHSMASAGNGYCWPSVLFVSDGDSVTVAARPSSEKAMGPVRYLSDITTRITVDAFEHGIDEFMAEIMSRLSVTHYPDSELAQLWSDVLSERSNEDIAKWRRLEALCGYDPDDAPETLIQSLINDFDNFGEDAIREVAAYSRHATAEALQSIRELDSKNREPLEGGFRCRPLALAFKPSYEENMRPWQKAAKLAQAARVEWDLGDGPISNLRLADLFKTNKKFFGDSQRSTVPMHLALRAANNRFTDVYISRPKSESRRFAASRLLGDWLEHGKDIDRLMPASDAGTARQQFQRAFAQEFLCPYRSLLDRFQERIPTIEDIDEAAGYFGVSSQVVKTTLVNKGGLDRGKLICA